MPYVRDRSRPLGPTFEGFCFDTTDALILFEAVLRRQLYFIPRRLVPGEYRDLVKSGSIFIYEEHESGIKRWTDGRCWSPSRVLDNFLVYRESEKLTASGEKKKNLKRKFSSTLDTPPGKREDHIDQAVDSPTDTVEPRPDGKRQQSAEEKELIKSLAGSFTDDNLCRENGLVKKTLSVTVNGLTYHMVSYYTIDDVKNNVLLRPSSDQRLHNIQIRPQLYKQNFRQAVYMPVEQASVGRSNPPSQEVYLQLAPGTHQIQLRQTTSPTQPLTYEMPNSPQAPGPTAHSTHSDAVCQPPMRQARPPEWTLDWSQPKQYYNPNMQLPHTNFIWNDQSGYGMSSQMLRARPLLPAPDGYQTRGYSVR